MRAILLAAVLLLQGCAFTQLREDLSEFYSNPAILTAQAVAETSTQVTRLDAPDFMESQGRKGLWQPLSFVKEKRGGVYLLEPYDAAKIPVLFIHGAGGTPQDWRYFIGKLDRTKYQAWVYYYPTGLPIDLSAQWLNTFVTALHAKYAFRQLIVTGHSMGGLVARRFIALNAHGAGQDYVKLWYSESGTRPNTIVRFDPKTEKFQTWAIPSGGYIVRKMDVTPDGNPVIATSTVNGVGLVEVK